MSGALITYNNTTDVFTVDGSARQPGQAGDGRVRATLSPKEKPAAPAPADAAPALRASPALAPAAE